MAEEEERSGGGGEGSQRRTYPSDPTVKPTGFSTVAYTPSCSPAIQYNSTVTNLLNRT